MSHLASLYQGSLALLTDLYELRRRLVCEARGISS